MQQSNQATPADRWRLRPGRRILAWRSACSLPGRRARLAHQGHRRLRGRAREPADRLRPRGRPQRHRRLAAQLALHPPEPASHAGAARRQRPRRHLNTKQRRRGDGDRQPAALRRARARRSTSPSRRWAMPSSLQGGTLLVDPAAGRRRRGLRGGARAARDRRLLGRRRRPDPRSPAACRPSGRIAERRAWSSARSRFDLAAQHELRLVAAQSRLHHRPAHRRRRSTPRSAPDAAQRDRSRHGACSAGPASYAGDMVALLDRDRAARRSSPTCPRASSSTRTPASS